MDAYHRWMQVTFTVTMAGLPALSVPAGFGGARNLPIGMQIVGPNHADLAVLQVGHAYERASPWIGQALPGQFGHESFGHGVCRVGACSTQMEWLHS